MLLSGAGGKAAEVAKPLADTAAGHKVTSLYESILHTAPTTQQLTTWANKIRHGVSAKVLRKDLTTEAKTQANAAIAAASRAAAIAHDPVIYPNGTAYATGVTPAIAGASPIINSLTGTPVTGASVGSTTTANSVGTSPASIAYNGYSRLTGGTLPSGLASAFSTPSAASTSLVNLTQVPAGMTYSLGYSGGSGSTSSTSTLASELSSLLGSTGTAGANSSTLASALEPAGLDGHHDQ